MDNFFLQSHDNTTLNVVQSYPQSNANNYAQNVVSLAKSQIIAKLPKTLQPSNGVGLGGLGSITISQSTTQKNNNLKVKKITKKLTPTEIQAKKSTQRVYLSKLKNRAGDLLAGHRVCFCGSCRIDNKAGVTLNVNTNADGIRSARWGNLIDCKDIHVCPECSKRMYRERGKEIARAFDKHKKAGKHISMVTFTHSHGRGDDLKVKLGLMGKAMSRFWGDRQNKAVFAQMGLIGHVKNLEFTHGWANGWHPHNHTLLFTDLSKEQYANERVAVTFEDLPDSIIGQKVRYVSYKREQKLIKQGRGGDIVLITFEDFLRYRWIELALAVGLGEPSWDNGLSLDDADNAEAYLAKFETAHELTDSHNKQGRGRSRNQWQILNDTLSDNLSLANSSIKLWREYANAVKGQRQLVWSRGLKAHFGIDDLDDDDLLLDVDDDNEVVKTHELLLSEGQWIKILIGRLQPYILNLAEEQGLEVVKNYLKSLAPFDTAKPLNIIFDKNAPPNKKPDVGKNPYPDFSPSWEAWERKNNCLYA